MNALQVAWLLQHAPIPLFWPLHGPEKGWELAHDLPPVSSPHSCSINDYIDPAQFSLSYCTIDNAITLINQLGPGCLY